MPSEITNFLSYIQHGFNLSAQADILLVVSVLFMGGLGYLGLAKTNNVYVALGCAFIALTICTVLTFMPLSLFFIISAVFSFYVAGKIFGVFT